MRLHAGLLVVFVAGLVTDVGGQGRPDLDLTQVIREPATESKGQPRGGIIMGEPGVVRGGVTSGEPRSLPLTVRLLSVDPQACSWGQQLTYDIELRNTGDRALALPWSVRREDLRAGDERGLFRVATLSLWLVGPRVTSRALLGSVESLYGSPEAPQTMRALLPGQAVTIRATSRCSANEIASALRKGDTMPLSVRAGVHLSHDPSALGVTATSTETLPLTVSRP